MLTNQKQSRGFTLLELLLVLVVIIGILLASYSRYRKYQQEQALVALKQNVATLLQWTDACYAGLVAKYSGQSVTQGPTCTKNISPAITVAKCGIDLAKMLNSNLVPAKTTAYYQITAPTGISVTPPPANPCGQGAGYYAHPLKVSVTLNVNQKMMPWYAQMLGASGISNTTLYWRKMPSYSIPGIGNNLWILGAGLAVFKKAETLAPTTS